MLILDEPTNHLDIESKEVLKKRFWSFRERVSSFPMTGIFLTGFRPGYGTDKTVWTTIWVHTITMWRKSRHRFSQGRSTGGLAGETEKPRTRRAAEACSIVRKDTPEGMKRKSTSCRRQRRRIQKEEQEAEGSADREGSRKALEKEISEHRWKTIGAVWKRSFAQEGGMTDHVKLDRVE